MNRCPLCWLDLAYQKELGVWRNYTLEQAYYFHLQNEHKRTLEEIESLKRQVEAGTIGRKA